MSDGVNSPLVGPAVGSVINSVIDSVIYGWIKSIRLLIEGWSGEGLGCDLTLGVAM